MSKKSQDHSQEYAIIKTGGKQYRVAIGDIIDVELLHTDNKEKDAEVSFAEVLMVNNSKGVKVGTPSVANFAVKGVVQKEVGGEKITSIKYKRSHNEYRKFGHRQHYSRVKITAIGA